MRRIQGAIELHFDCHPLDGYRRLTFMMLDEEVVALSPCGRTAFAFRNPRPAPWFPVVRKRQVDFFATVHREDFKTFIRISGMTHVRTAPYYPQSNGIERWHKTIKSDALRPANPSSRGSPIDRRILQRGSLQPSAIEATDGTTAS